jgi:hypothetical protein
MAQRMRAESIHCSSPMREVITCETEQLEKGWFDKDISKISTLFNIQVI